jgi:uncharacterized protein
MQLESARRISAPPRVVWEKLNDTDTLKACIAGCESLEPDGEDRFALTLKTRIGPVAATFKGRLTLTDVVPGQAYTLNFDGQGGAAGFGRGSARVRLQPIDAETELRYSAKAEIGGRLAQLGQRLIDGAARAMVDDFFTRFERRLAASAAPPAPARRNVPAWLWVSIALAAACLLWLLLR